MYVNDDLNYKRKNTAAKYDDLPVITVEVGVGREKKTTVQLLFQEFVI